MGGADEAGPGDGSTTEVEGLPLAATVTTDTGATDLSTAETEAETETETEATAEAADPVDEAPETDADDAG